MAHGGRGLIYHGMTSAIQAQRVRRRVRVASPGGQDVSTLDEVVQSLNLNAAEGSIETFRRDELWKTFVPQACELLR